MTGKKPMKRLFPILAILTLATTSSWATELYSPNAFPLPAPPTTTVSTSMKCTPNPAAKKANGPTYTLPVGTIITSCVVSPANWNGSVPPLADTRLRVIWWAYNSFYVVVYTKPIVPGNYSVAIASAP